MNAMDELKTEYLFEYEGICGMPHVVSDEFNVAIVREGWFKGPRLKGKIIHGADWLTLNDNGINRPDVRLLLQTDDDYYIYMHYQGVLLDLEGENPSLRINPMFKASDKYAWLNKAMAVGVCKSLTFSKTRIVLSYDVYQIL